MSSTVSNGIEKKYYKEIDFLKGITIVLVVLGHALAYNTTSHIGEESELRTILYTLIYSFHMPMFFMISGFLSGITRGKKNVIRNKFVRLMVPYFFVGLCYMPLKMALSAFARFPFDVKQLWKILLGTNPDEGLWFLYVLFACSVLAHFLVTEKSVLLVAIFSFVISIVAFAFNPHVPYIYETLKYFLFYVLGIYIKQNYEPVLSFTRGMIARCGKIITVAIPMVLWLGFWALNRYVIYGFDITPLTGIFGSAFVYAVAMSVVYTEKNLLISFGKASMGIYIFHGMIQVVVRTIFWSKLQLNYFVVVGAKFFIGFIGAYICYLIVKRFKLLSLLVLGENRYKAK